MSSNKEIAKLKAEVDRLKSQLSQTQEDVQRLRTILEVLPDHIMLLDVAGKILDINHTVPELTVKDVIGTPIFQYMSEDAHTDAANCLKSVWESGQASSYETKFQPQDGNTQYFETKVVLFQENDARIGLLAESRNITLKHETLKKIQVQSEALTSSQELANIGSWDLDVKSGELAWSDQVYRIFGLPPSEFQATYEAFLGAIHPDDRDMVNQAYSRAMENKTPYDIVHRVLRPNGSVRVVRETSQDILDSSGTVVRSMGIVHDITEQHAIQKAIEEKERFLSTLMANIPGMVYRCLNTPDWPMEYISQGSSKLTGYAPSELVGSTSLTFNSLIHPDDRDQVWAEVQDALNTETFFEITYRIKNADGKYRWVWERGRGIYDDDGAVQALEGFVTDYSSIMDEQQKSLDLERMIMKSQKLKSLGLMAGGIAHDFNNLLTVILGNAEMALHGLDEKSSICAPIKSIKGASQRAADLAQQMLAYSGHYHFTPEDISINKLLKEITAIMRISLSNSENLELNLKENLPEFAGDIAQVRQVAMNLITNASEAMNEQPGTISVISGSTMCDRDYLDQTCANYLMQYQEPLAEGQYIFFEVSDTGTGMDHATLDKIFDPFFTTKFTGRGLGLAATLGIIRGHLGTLVIKSEEGDGTSFKVLFPSLELSVQLEKPPQ